MHIYQNGKFYYVKIVHQLGGKEQGKVNVCRGENKNKDAVCVKNQKIFSIAERGRGEARKISKHWPRTLHCNLQLLDSY